MKRGVCVKLSVAMNRILCYIMIGICKNTDTVKGEADSLSGVLYGFCTKDWCGKSI